jgi:hypothetical protein
MPMPRPDTVLGPVARLAKAIATLPAPAQSALDEVAARADLPLAAGVWNEGEAGCLVANVVAAVARGARGERSDAGTAAGDGSGAVVVAGDDSGAGTQTLDLRILELIPEMSSRDLNRLIVAWDEAALQDGSTTDAGLRELLRAGLTAAGVGVGAPTRALQV